MNDFMKKEAFDMQYDFDSANLDDLGIVKSPLDYLKNIMHKSEVGKQAMGKALLNTGGPIGLLLDKAKPKLMDTGYIGDDIKGNKMVNEFSKDYLRKHFRKNIEKGGQYKSYQDWIDSDTSGILSAMETGDLSMRSPKDRPDIMHLIGSKGDSTRLNLKMLHDASILSPEVFKDKYGGDVDKFKSNIPYDLLVDYIPTLEGKKEYYKRGFFEKPRKDYTYEKAPGYLENLVDNLEDGKGKELAQAIFNFGGK